MASVRKQIELDEDTVKWFHENYSAGRESVSSLSWILNLLLTSFKDAHTATPTAIAKSVGQGLKEELE